MNGKDAHLFLATLADLRDGHVDLKNTAFFALGLVLSILYSHPDLARSKDDIKRVIQQLMALVQSYEGLSPEDLASLHDDIAALHELQAALSAQNKE